MKKEEAISVLEQAELKVGIKWRNGRPEVYISPYLQEAIDFALDTLKNPTRQVKTCELVSEIKNREGVETHVAEPYQDVTVSVNGPAVVLVVID